MFEEAKNVRIVTEPNAMDMFVTVKTKISVTKNTREKVIRAKDELKTILPIVHSLTLTNNTLRLIVKVPMRFNTLDAITNISAASVVLLHTIKDSLETWDKIRAIAADLKPYYDESNK